MEKQQTGLVKIETVIFSILEGSMVALGAVVAPLIFRRVKSRDQAGRLFGNILRRWYWVGLGCTISLVVTGVVSILRFKPARGLLVTRQVVTWVMLGLLVAFGRILGRMDVIRAGLTKPIEEYPEDTDPRLEFNRLHRRSTSLMKTDMAAGIFWLALSLLARRGQK